MRTAVFVASLLVWLSVGLIWLLPRKLRLMRRLGHLTPDEIIQRGKDGDVEAKKLHRDTIWFVAVGLIVLLPQAQFPGR
jgi:hypothetical protein